MAIKSVWQVEEDKKQANRREFLYWGKLYREVNGMRDGDPRFHAGLLQKFKENQRVTIGRFEFMLQITSIPRRSDRDQSEWDRDASHYQVTLSVATVNGKRDKQYTFEYSQGSGIEGWPRARRVLESIVMDAQSGIDDFDDFCSNFGYDNDSMSADRTWRACRKVTKFFNQIGLNDDGIIELDELLRQDEDK